MTDRSPSAFPSLAPRLMVLGLMVLPALPAIGAGRLPGDDEGACTRTASLLFDACGHTAESAALVANARCVNLRHEAAREKCRHEADKALDEARAFCVAERGGRQDACSVLGERRYDPAFEAARFDPDPRHPSVPNPFMPVAVGAHWEYHGGGEFNTVDMRNEVKLMEGGGVTCMVVRDLVYDGKGRLTEATDDWIATARDGAVWYCGEEVKEYEYPRGDHPRHGELVSISGSFKHGRDGALAGLLMPASPVLGQAYREEAALAQAEDWAQVISVDYGWGKDAELDRFMPQALVELLCSNDCIVTRNVSQLEPGVTERKYYSRGIGVFAETTAGRSLDSQLTACNVDSRCASLPPPARR